LEKFKGFEGLKGLKRLEFESVIDVNHDHYLHGAPKK